MEKINLTDENSTEVISEITDRIRKWNGNTIYVQYAGKEWGVRVEQRRENNYATKDITCRARKDIHNILSIIEGYAKRIPNVEKSIEQIVSCILQEA